MVKSVGKPDARNGHVRFDERGRETGGCQEAPHRALPRLYAASLKRADKRAITPPNRVFVSLSRTIELGRGKTVAHLRVSLRLSGLVARTVNGISCTLLQSIPIPGIYGTSGTSFMIASQYLRAVGNHEVKLLWMGHL